MSLLDDLGRSSEETVLQRAREGDVSAFGALYDRHLSAARRLARSLVADHSDADDVVAEVFAAAFAAMSKGLGPSDNFRSYLLTSVRRECHRTWRRGGRQRPAGEVVVEIASARPTIRDDFDAFDESDVVHRAFAALPPRMQHVLWLTEIEGLSHEEVAVRMGASSAAVAQLARRARLQFGERYLEAHLPSPDGAVVPRACVGPRRVLAEVVRGTASRRDERLAAEHMASCASCSEAHEELGVVNGRLRGGHLAAVLPLLAASKPIRIGLVARIAAWIAGPVPALTAAVTLAVATAVVPTPDDVAVAERPAGDTSAERQAAVAPTGSTQGAERSDDPAVTPTGAGSRRSDAVDPALQPSSSAPPTTAGADPDVAPADAAGAVPAAEGAVVPEGATTPAPVVPGTAAAVAPATGGSAGPGAGVPGGSAGPGSPLDPTGAVEDVVDAVTVDDPVIDAVRPVLDALPAVDVSVTIPPTPAVGPVGPTGPVSVEVGVGGGEVDVGAGIGGAQVGVGVGGTGGLDVDLPSVPDVVGALPDPVPDLLGRLGVGPLLGG